MNDEALVSKICDKYVSLSGEINKDDVFSMMKSRKSERYAGTPNLKNVLIKCSPQIKKHIIKTNDRYVYVRLSSCESFDHFLVM